MLPCFVSYSFISRFSSFVNLDSTVFTAPAWAMMPLSPRAALASISSCSHCLWRVLSSFCFSQRCAWRALFESFVRFDSASCSSFSTSSAGFAPSSAPALSLPAVSVVLTLPYPASSARPTSDCFSAPTSLPPSPHISTCRPCRWSSRITADFPCGVIRAKTRMWFTTSQNSGWASTAASSASPVTIRVNDSVRSATLLEIGLRSPRAGPVATSHSTSAPSPDPGARVRSSPGRPLSVMPQVCAMWSAVRGESPVSMPTWWSDSRNAPITRAESARAKHSKAMKPAKRRWLSMLSRFNRASFSHTSSWERRRYASASTRRPRSARPV
mmetsp:Transcript_87148/g.247090  ORF Transcript_87148/g.247090 Transcript_87148/m.247090 type:complete len:327 (-) Transcript_87148:231-1211(-)